MKGKGIFLIVAIFIGIFILGYYLSLFEEKDVRTSLQEQQEIFSPGVSLPESSPRRIHFTQFNPVYRFSAEISANWEVTYIPEIQAINISDPSLAGENSTEKSQIFIRNFSANNFLTLSTVTISQRKSTKVKGHDAVEYEITKKPGVPHFPYQPSWRNATHHSMDIRFSTKNPSPFYTIGYNPVLRREVFDEFLASLQFHNDPESFEPVLVRLKERVIKKPFGVLISPQNSPIENERFSGYHTGIDFEVFDDELQSNVSVKALCGGVLRQKQYASGYGGVAVQECLLQGEVVTVVYGHLNLQSILASEGEYLDPGDTVGLLGADKSSQTDGERKHLHLGIHRGESIDIRGYVPTVSQLSQWRDPQPYVFPSLQGSF